MKVLDVGSGAGDVALLLADRVGPSGKVVGVEIDPTVLETARAGRGRQTHQRLLSGGRYRNSATGDGV